MSAAEEHFREKIAETYGLLTKSFVVGVRSRDREAFQEMGRMIGEHSILGTPSGQRIQGAEAIGLFFEDLWRKGHTGITFELKALWLVPTTDPIPTKNKGDQVVEVGYAVTEFRCQGNPDEVVGGWCSALSHMLICPVIP
jgi:hypothetical protein